MTENKESHLEEELADALEQLLGCTELNLDDMEQETRDAIQRAFFVLETRQAKV